MVVRFRAAVIIAVAACVACGEDDSGSGPRGPKGGLLTFEPTDIRGEAGQENAGGTPSYVTGGAGPTSGGADSAPASGGISAGGSAGATGGATSSGGVATGGAVGGDAGAGGLGGAAAGGGGVGGVPSEPECQGVATPCSLLTTSECTTVPGCSISGDCSGSASSCYSQYSSYSCTSQQGCYWSSSTDRCSGSAWSCSLFDGPYTCASQNYCSWNEECAGTPTSCDLLDELECDSHPGCYLVY